MVTVPDSGYTRRWALAAHGFVSQVLDIGSVGTACNTRDNPASFSLPRPLSLTGILLGRPVGAWPFGLCALDVSRKISAALCCNRRSSSGSLNRMAWRLRTTDGRQAGEPWPVYTASGPRLRKRDTPRTRLGCQDRIYSTMLVRCGEEEEGAKNCSTIRPEAGTTSGNGRGGKCGPCPTATPRFPPIPGRSPNTSWAC